MRERGLTITELMVVITIMGVLTAVATPSLSRWLTSIRMESTTREIASTLQLTRIKAITQNTNFGIAFDTAANTYQVQKCALANPTKCIPVGSVKTFPTGVQLVSITGNPVTFQSGRGSTPVGSNSTITLQSTQGKQADIVVAQSGRVTVRKY